MYAIYAELGAYEENIKFLDFSITEPTRKIKSNLPHWVVVNLDEGVLKATPPDSNSL